MPRRDLDKWLWQVGEELKHLSDESSSGAPKLARGHRWRPNVDITELGTHLRITAELAGVREEDIRVLYRQATHSLILLGERREPKHGRKVAHQLEIFHGEFEREIKLPDSSLDVEAMRAGYEHGILTVVIPKDKESGEMDMILVTGRVVIQQR